MNFSLPGLLYSSQNSGYQLHAPKGWNGRRTVTPEQTIVLENVQNPTHLAEDENTRTLDFHDNNLSRVIIFPEFGQGAHLSCKEGRVPGEGS